MQVRKIAETAYTLWRHGFAPEFATENAKCRSRVDYNFTTFDFARNHRRAAGSATVAEPYVHLSAPIYITVARTRLPPRIISDSLRRVSTSVRKRRTIFWRSIDRSFCRSSRKSGILPPPFPPPVSFPSDRRLTMLRRLIPEAVMIALLINAWSHHGLHGRLQRCCTAPCGIPLYKLQGTRIGLRVRRLSRYLWPRRRYDNCQYVSRTNFLRLHYNLSSVLINFLRYYLSR